jgi:hypothetical protein
MDADAGMKLAHLRAGLETVRKFANDRIQGNSVESAITVVL